MQTINVGIIGLGRIGASVALALKRYSASKDARQQFAITGYDPAPNAAAGLQARGGLDQAARHIAAAASDKDIVVLALPYSETASAYPIIGRDLREGCVVLDASPLKQPSLKWAEKHIASGAHMIGITPVVNSVHLWFGLNDEESAAPTLFDKGMMLLMPSVKADRDAVELASDFSELLGAQSHFVDPAEHDVWMTMVEAFPAALGVAAFNTLRGREGWSDAQRAGNTSFGLLTHHLKDTHPDDLRDLMLNSRETLARQLDGMIETLEVMRSILRANDRDALETLLIDNRDAYFEWFIHRQESDWDKTRSAQPERGNMILSGLFGSMIANRFKRDQDKDDEDK